MLQDLTDTIVALSSAAGPGARAVVRLSGPAALRVAGAVFTAAAPPSPTRRGLYSGAVSLPGVAAALPADLYFWPAPATYTGQNLAELHTVSSPPLVELLLTALLNAGARAAGPGEFTLRAFLAGKLDLPRAEAVLGVIEAGTRDELRDALAQMAGGVTQPLRALRSDLLDLLADVEAGLDFADEDVQTADPTETLNRLARAMAHVTLLQKQLDQRALGERPFRVVLVGPPNAGKSSLFNALTGGSALVSPEPGTTRDYLVRRLELEGVRLEVVDTAGRRGPSDAIEEQAQALGHEQARMADLLLRCVDLTRPAAREAADAGEAPTLDVFTKADLVPPPADVLATSAVTGAGLAALRSRLLERVRAHRRPALAPSLSRCRHHVAAALDHLRRAHHTALFQEPAELLALELRGALDQLGEMVGAVYTDDLLDRIFSRFCIGK
jgi:tRNA modification GTPase